MEIISYLKGKKAQEELKTLHAIIGQDAYKSGVRDVVDVWADADERIEKLEQKHENDVLNDRIESLTELVAINLSKQHLFASMQADLQQTKHEQLIFQDFDSTSDYVPSKSSNVSLTANGIKPTNSLANGVITLKPEPAKQLMKLMVTTTHSNTNGMEIPLALTAIQSLENLEVVSGQIRFLKNDTTYNTYSGKGTIIFNPITLPESLQIDATLHNLNLQSSDVKWFYASSVDGISFSEYQPLVSGSVIEHTVSIKVELTNGVPTAGVKAVNHQAFGVNAYTEIKSSQLQLKKTHEVTSTPDPSWTGEGTLFKVSINEADWSILNGIGIV